MKRKIRFLAGALLCVLALYSSADAQKMKMKEKSSKTEQLRLAMHKLWEDHVTWTRNVILNIVDDLPGTDQAVARLMRNQDDIGNAIKPVYGEAAGTELTRLLKEHISVAAALLKAAKTGNNAA